MSNGEKQKRKLGEILLEDGVLSRESLSEALLHQKKEGGVIGQILIRLGYVSEEDLIAALSKQLQIPYLPLLNYAVNGDAVKSYDLEFCKRNMVIVFDMDEDYLYIATADPLNDTVVEIIQRNYQKPAQVFLSKPTEISNMLDLAFASLPARKPENKTG